MGSLSILLLLHPAASAIECPDCHLGLHNSGPNLANKNKLISNSTPRILLLNVIPVICICMFVLIDILREMFYSLIFELNPEIETYCMETCNDVI